MQRRGSISVKVPVAYSAGVLRNRAQRRNDHFEKMCILIQVAVGNVPRGDQKGAKREPKGSQGEPKGAKSEPRGAKSEPRGAKSEPKGAKKEPKWSQGATKMHIKIDLRKRSRKVSQKGGRVH